MSGKLTYMYVRQVCGSMYQGIFCAQIWMYVNNNISMNILLQKLQNQNLKKKPEEKLNHHSKSNMQRYYMYKSMKLAIKTFHLPQLLTAIRAQLFKASLA